MHFFAFYTLQNVLEKCGIEETKSKASPPSTIMSFLGIVFNTITITIGITPEIFVIIEPIIIVLA